MSQIEKNKKELFELMETLADMPLSKDSIRNLGTLMGAYKALCLVSHKERDEEPEEIPPERARAKAVV